MTVRDLIKELRKKPMDTKVRIYDADKEKWVEVENLDMVGRRFVDITG